MNFPQNLSRLLAGCPKTVDGFQQMFLCELEHEAVMQLKSLLIFSLGLEMSGIASILNFRVLTMVLFFGPLGSTSETVQ